MTTLAAAQAALARANAQRATAHYQEGQTLTVSPGQLVILLYEGALRFLRRARIAIDSGDIEASHQAIRRAQDIIFELDATLDPETGAIATNLHRIYEYCLRRLVEANMLKSVEPIGEVIGYCEVLADAWREAVKQVDSSGTPGNAGGLQIQPLPQE